MERTRQNTKQTNTTTHRRKSTKPAGSMHSAPHLKNEKAKIANAHAVRFIPLGGLEEIGRNSAYFEYKNEIVVVDLGIQFPEEETPGIDYIIPNVTSLEPKKKNIRGIIFTHGHYDHIHALPYLIEKLGNPIIYTAMLTKALIEKRVKEFPNLPKLKFHIVKNGDIVKISENFTAEFFDIAHTIPDGLGFVLNTPAGKMAHFGDFRLETGEDGKPVNTEIFSRIGKQGLHSIFIDSTNSLKEGLSISEKSVEENLEALFRKAKGRILVGTFASLLDRLNEIIKIADRLGRKVAINGRSIKDNMAIAQQLGYIKPKQGQMIAVEEMSKYRDDQLLVLVTGSQGEPNARFTRLVNGDDRKMSLKPSDTIIFSSSVVPGNERSVQALQDNISRQVDEIYNVKLLDIHTSGHANAEDLKIVMHLTKPKYVVPIHAYYFMRKHVKKLGEEINFNRDNVIMMDNGQVAELTKTDFMVTQETVPTDYVIVDGSGVGDVEHMVLRDRRILAEEGMVVIITTMERRSGRIVKNPDIISRGFIHLKENKALLDEIRKRLRSIISRVPHGKADPDYLKMLIRDQIGQFLFQKTKRRPMVLPVIIEV